MVKSDREFKGNRRCYEIEDCEIQDYPTYKWRHFNLDVASHYFSVKEILRTIDAMVLQKLNVLLLTVSNSASFPIQFKKKPQSRLVRGSWTPYHYYTKEDVMKIQEYALRHGITVVPEMRLPSQIASWGKADARLLADCPDLVRQNENNAVLNPLFKDTYDYVLGAISELVEFFFTPFNISPVLHLGGRLDNFDCWKMDREISLFAE